MDLEQFQLHAEIEEKHWWFVARRRILCRLIRALVPASRDLTVVDIGCGTGANAAALAEDYKCWGIDASPEAIEWAQKRYPRVHFICGNIPGDLGEAAREADLFLLADVLEHVEADGRFLSEIVAFMKPGSHILVTVPCDPGLWTKHDESFGHFRRYEENTLRRLWQDWPVTERLLCPFNTRLYPLVKAVRTVNQWRGDVAGRAGTDFRIPWGPVNTMLTSIFSGEGNGLEDRLQGRRQTGAGRGVSLVAILRRDVGEVRSGKES